MDKPQLIGELEESIKECEDFPRKYCPMYHFSKLNALAIANNEVGIGHLRKEFSKCYSCNGQDNHCQVYRNHLNSPLLS